MTKESNVFSKTQLPSVRDGIVEMARRATSKAPASVQAAAANVIAAQFEHMKAGLVNDYHKAGAHDNQAAA